jgi:hemolysin-activating ACP:hemolysin acyltransferase
MTCKMTCKQCRYFIDYSEFEPPDEPNGYCSWALAHDKANPYGGHWTHTDATCEHWTQGPSVWVEMPPLASLEGQ